MKKFVLILLLLICMSITMILFNNNSSTKERVALNFIQAYYLQYEKRDEIKELIDKGLIDVELFEEYARDYVGHIVTEECLKSLIANRYVPKITVVNTNIKNVKVVDRSFACTSKSNDIEQYDFEISLKMTRDDESIENLCKKGWIVLKKIDGQWLVDGFRLYN